MNIQERRKNILVVSDHYELSCFFQEECARQELEYFANIDYCYTNKKLQKMASIGAKLVNIKEEAFQKYASKNYDLIISIHCQKIFPKELINSVLCINLHPGFNPYNRGWYPHIFSIVNKLPSGATLHIMDDKIDHGDIISQEQISINSYDTSFDVYKRIIEVEKNLLRNNLISLVNKSYSSVKPCSEGNYNSISDFNKLCHLDLDSIGTLRDHIDLLRALTHENLSNAYFIDDDDRKIYVRISLNLSES